MEPENKPRPIFLNRADLAALGIKVSNSTLLRWEQAGRFPRRARFGGTMVAWPRHLVMQWCEDRIAERERFHYGDGSP
ncbi:AlpA family phage regulatory protein [bacterium]|nr:AlpA family phage regulatory protein [bacterium]